MSLMFLQGGWTSQPIWSIYLTQLPFVVELFWRLDFWIVLYIYVVYCLFVLLTRAETGRKEIVVGRVPAQRRDLQFLNSNDESDCRR